MTNVAIHPSPLKCLVILPWERWKYFLFIMQHATVITIMMIVLRLSKFAPVYTQAKWTPLGRQHFKIVTGDVKRIKMDLAHRYMGTWTNQNRQAHALSLSPLFKPGLVLTIRLKTERYLQLIQRIFLRCLEFMMNFPVSPTPLIFQQILIFPTDRSELLVYHYFYFDEGNLLKTKSLYAMSKYLRASLSAICFLASLISFNGLT